MILCHVSDTVKHFSLCNSAPKMIIEIILMIFKHLFSNAVIMLFKDIDGMANTVTTYNTATRGKA